MKIGIDLDDVVFEFTKTFLDYYYKKYGKEIKFEDVKTYYFQDIFDLSLGEVVDLIRDMASKGIVENLPPCDYAKESILNLAKDHEIIFLTSRIVQQGTLESLKKLFPNIEFRLIYSSNPYANSEGKTKGNICCQEDIDIMIEDTKEHANEIAANGTKVLLLDKPWNQDYQEHPKIIKINHWKEVGENIK